MHAAGRDIVATPAPAVSPASREIGCACEIDRVLERMEDGRMNLLARGARPFRVLERVGRLAYPAGVIEFVDDREEPPDPDAAAGRKAALLNRRLPTLGVASR